MAVVVAWACSYTFGAIPFSNVAALRRSGTDLRDVGTGTVSGTSLFEVTGFGTLAVAGSLDVLKGAVGPLMLLGHAGPAAVAAGLAVVGHNWSVFLRGRGGRGLSPAIGGLLVVAWPGAVLLLGAMAVGRLLHATGLVVWGAQLSLVPALAAWGGAAAAFAAVCVVVPMWAKRLEANGRPRSGALARTMGSRWLLDRDDGRPGGRAGQAERTGR